MAIGWIKEKATSYSLQVSLNNSQLLQKKILTNMDKNTVIHIGAELNIQSESVKNVENKTEVKIHCCGNQV